MPEKPTTDQSAQSQPPAESPPTEAPKPKLDVTIPGGKYLKDGQLVNANGEPIDETGRVLKLQ